MPKKIYNYNQETIYLDANLKAALKAHCVARGLKLTWALNQIVEEFLKKEETDV